MTVPARPVLTERELDVLERLAAGATYDAIARDYGLASRTLCWIGQRIMRKLGARNVAHAVLLACRAGILDGRPQERHGDHAGYEAHRRRGEDPKQCPHGCWAGERAYRAAQRRTQQPRERRSAPPSRPRSAPADSGPSGLENASEAHSPASRPTNQTKAA